MKVQFSPRRRWTKAEKWLLATPVLVGVFALAMDFGPELVRRQRGLPIVLMTSPANALISTDLSRDGSLLVAGGQLPQSTKVPYNSIFLWQGSTLKPLLPINRPATFKKGNVDFCTPAVAASPNGRFVAYGKELNGLQIFDRQTQKIRWQTSGLVTCVQFSPDGKSLVVGSDDGIYRVFDVQSARLIARWTNCAQGETIGEAVEFSSDGQLLASVGRRPHPDAKNSTGRDEGGAVEIRRANTWKIECVLPAPLPSTRLLAFSPDGKSLVSVSYLSPAPGAYDGSLVRCFDIQGGRILWEISSRDRNADVSLRLVAGVRLSSDGKLALLVRDGVLLLDANTSQIQRKLLIPAHSGNSPLYFASSLKFSPDGKRLFAIENNTMFVWDLD